MNSIRVVVVEDEELQRNQVVAWLTRHPELEVIGVAADGLAATQMIDELRPDLVLLDISLPECSGLDVLARIRHVPDVVFTTAYRDHAVEAFELGAVDYLLKPFAADRLSAALERVRTRERTREMESAAERVELVRDNGEPLERLFVRERGAIIPIRVDAIIRLEADGDYTAVYSGERRYLVAVSLGALLERMRKPDFVRVHRQHVVNMAHVLRLVPYDAGRLQIVFRNSPPIIASRTGSQELRGLVQ